MNLDFDKMAENITAERAERDSRSAESLNRMSEETKAQQMQWNAELYKAMASDKNNRTAMEKEIAEIQSEADRRIQQVKDRYAARYGRTNWNSTLADSFRDLAGDLTKSR